MSLEACVVCVDSSAFARDADLHPTRLAAQLDATSLLANAKLNAHRENAVGIVTMGGDGARVSVSPTSEFGRIHSAFHDISAKGDADFIRGILVAQLALKRRMNKTQRQRILLFVGSPVMASEKQLVQVGRQLKKNNIALDIVCLANVEENRAKLMAMHAAVNSNDTSRFVEYPAGSTNLLSDVIVSAMLLHDPEAAVASEGTADAAATAAAVNEFGVDPNVDPDLYMVLRMSLEEARQQQAQQQQQQQDSAVAAAATGQSAAAGATELPPGTAQIEGLEDMDEELRQAVLLSLQDYCGEPPASGSSGGAANQQAEAVQGGGTGNDSAELPGEGAQQEGGAPSVQPERREGDSAEGGDETKS
ncbi:26S proteasome regulatory subunit rpn10 [Cyclospora cayetanensis]|uniref:26S proteasome regulatory subunit rpn10 n=1 Tax=Cyclospora cayetanensis TaxID=88456 RepID=A0A6P6RWZ7_9EIME|nr:26S proteasome regulatory subunit rpn10 [Cyclospora cayetanensis]